MRKKRLVPSLVLKAEQPPLTPPLTLTLTLTLTLLLLLTTAMGGLAAASSADTTRPLAAKSQ